MKYAFQRLMIAFNIALKILKIDKRNRVLIDDRSGIELIDSDTVSMVFQGQEQVDRFYYSFDEFSHEFKKLIEGPASQKLPTGEAVFVEIGRDRWSVINHTGSRYTFSGPGFSMVVDQSFFDKFNNAIAAITVTRNNRG